MGPVFKRGRVEFGRRRGMIRRERFRRIVQIDAEGDGLAALRTTVRRLHQRSSLKMRFLGWSGAVSPGQNVTRKASTNASRVTSAPAITTIVPKRSPPGGGPICIPLMVMARVTEGAAA